MRDHPAHTVVLTEILIGIIMGTVGGLVFLKLLSKMGGNVLVVTNF